MLYDNNTPEYISDSTPSLNDDEYFASLEALADAAVTSNTHQKASEDGEIDVDSLMSAFTLLDRALQTEGLTPEQAEAYISKASSKLSAARPKRSDKFTSVDLTSLVDVATKPIPMVDDAFIVEGSGKSLLPAGELIWIQAPPASGKSFLTTSQCLELARAGLPSVFIDFESTATVFVRRVLMLGGTAEDLKHITYLSPSAGWSGSEMREIIAQAVTKVVEVGARLLVVDGFAQASVRLGFDENSNSDMSLFADALTGIAYSTGCPVLVIDHVSKVAADTGSRWSRGASAKLSSPAMSYTVRVQRSPAMGIEGSIEMVIAKDRHGCVGSEGDTACVVRFSPTARDNIEGGLVVSFVSSAASAPYEALTLMMLARRLRESEGMTKTEIRNLTYDRGEKEGKKCFSRKRFEEVVAPMLDILIDQQLVATEELSKGYRYHWCGGEQGLNEEEAGAVLRKADPNNKDPF